jgi:tetratricopeptide (TPR) repeat protein
VTIAATAESTLDAAIAEPRRPVLIQGPSGSGKTSLALAIGELAAERDMYPLVVRPPATAPESGPVAVGAAIAALDGGEFVAHPKRYRDGLTKLRWELHEKSDRVIVIADEPSAWSAGESYFAALAREAVDVFIGDPNWPTVLLDQGASVEPFRRLDVEPLDIEFEHWGALATPAQALAGRAPADRPRNGLELALSSALLAWGHAVPEPPASASRLAEVLADVLARRRAGPRLWALWQRLALARTELPDLVLRDLGLDSLDDLSRDTLRYALLDGGGRLHEAVRVVVEREAPANPLPGADRTDVHRRLFDYHREHSAATTNPTEAAASAAEALFHLGELNEEDLIDTVPILFVDQLNALGRTMSFVHRDHFSAAGIFARAVDLDPANDYSQHYRGFNLDFQGERRHEVSERYENAIAIDPSKPWWHARRVTFLADVGQLRAARAAWDQAQSQAAANNVADFNDLHAWVAGALIHQGELEFADAVLSAVPSWAATDDTTQLRRALSARFEAQDRGTVVPAPRSSERWWQKPPRALSLTDTDGRRLASWIAGRVDSIDEEGVHLRVGVVENAAAPRFGVALIDRERWHASCLDGVDPDSLSPGRFLEIGNYRAETNDDRLAIRLVEPDPHRQPIPPLMPLGRWLRADAFADAAKT